MARRKSDAKANSDRTPRRALPPPPAVTPIRLNRKPRTPTSQPRAVDTKVGDVGSKGSVSTTAPCDQGRKLSAKQHEPDKLVTNSPDTNNRESKSKRRKTVKPSADVDTPKMPTRAPSKRKLNPKFFGAIRKDEGAQIPISDSGNKGAGSGTHQDSGRDTKKDGKTEATLRRSQRQKTALPDIGPAPPLVKGVNKYGFTIWVPATGPIDVGASRIAEQTIAESRSVPKAEFSHDVTLDHALRAAQDERDIENTGEVMLDEHVRDNGEEVIAEKAIGEGIRKDMRESMPMRDDAVDASFITEHSKMPQEPRPTEKDTDAQAAGDDDEQQIRDQDVQMVDVDDARESIFAPTSGGYDSAPQVNRPPPQALISGETAITSELNSPLIANANVKRPTPDSLHWRAAEKLTKSGVHFFNMPVGELREMARLQALEQARPQSSEELRALLISATTNGKSIPEEHALANSRVKLQAGRIALYGIQLRERMATLRMVAARATQQPRTLIDQLVVIVNEACNELGAAQKSLGEDVRGFTRAEQALKNVTGKAVSEPNDLVMDADALRRDGMIKEINAAIAEYETQMGAQDGVV